VPTIIGNGLLEGALAGAGPPAAPTFVQLASIQSNSSGGSTFTVVLANTPKVGNLLVALTGAMGYGTAGFGGYITAPGAGWNAIGAAQANQLVPAGGSSIYTLVGGFTRVVQVGDGKTYVFTMPAGWAALATLNGQVFLYELAGAGATPVVSATAGVNIHSNTGAALSLTPSAYPSLCLASIAASTAAATSDSPTVGASTSAAWPALAGSEVPDQQITAASDYGYGSCVGGMTPVVLASGSIDYDNYQPLFLGANDTQCRNLIAVAA
jgi:hypothetical protein